MAPSPWASRCSRLWLQSMTPQAIRDGFDACAPNAQMQPLADAARCRSEADWLVGINGTRAMTAFNSRDGGFLPDHRGPGADPHALGGGRARRADPQVREPRLLGSPRHLCQPKPVSTRASGSTRSHKKDAERRRKKGRPRVVPGRSQSRSPTPCAASPPRSAKKASPPPRLLPCCLT